MAIETDKYSPEEKRRKRELFIISALLLCIPIILYYASRALRWNIELSVKHKILVFSLININVILLLLLLYLILRNLVKLFIQQKRGIIGSHIRSKLVACFVILSLFPTGILFVASVQYISSSVDYWFSRQIDKAIEDANQMGNEYRRLLVDNFSDEISSIIALTGEDGFINFLKNVRKDLMYNVFMISKDGDKLYEVYLNQENRIKYNDVKEFLESHACFKSGSCESGYIEINQIPIIYTASRTLDGLNKLIVLRQIPDSIAEKSKHLSIAFNQYTNLASLRIPIKSGYIISLTIVTLLIIFSSLWFGIYLSREITIPIQALADATRRIASGDYDFVIDMKSKDEIGLLVNSFNRMTKELKLSKQSLEFANNELKNRNQELTRQKQYMEFVLGNIGAGVLSTDASNIITTFNSSAEKLLNMKAEKAIGLGLMEILPSEVWGWCLSELRRKGGFRKQMKFFLNGRPMNLLFSINLMKDASGMPLGSVAVFEDLTEIEKAQRMEAWQEVARRIAHEVKNPLTPIQLSAQRLKKKLYSSLDGRDRLVLEESTELILSQVDELKRLVDEFSMFARMPKSVKVQVNLESLAREIFEVFREKYREITWELNVRADRCEVLGDREQLRRAITNILNNAAEAVGANGSIAIGLINPSPDRLQISIKDNGPGIPAEHRHRVFEPYFSTKPQGGGLGLAITHSIISEHMGEIQLIGLTPKGTEVRLEFPVEVS